MFEIIDPGHPLRPQVEETIRIAFWRGHGARPTAFPRWLVADIGTDGVTSAAALRFAEDGFFSECYLDQPIERTIARHAGAPAERTAVAEVGSLAAAHPGDLRVIVDGIVGLLQARGTRWAFFTATDKLRTYLRRTGFPMLDLAPADPARLASAEAWGRYYRQDPRVMLVGDDMLAAARDGERRRHA